METVFKDRKAVKGGEFLVTETEAEDLFIPEEFDEDQMMMAQSCYEFIEQVVNPNVEATENHDLESLANVFRQAGELGLLGVSIPEEYEGLGMSFNTSMLIADALGPAGAFSTTYGAHTGIGTLPILYYGNEEQKKKYVGKLATGEWAASYCLTEPNAGSDANSGKTKAVLTEDGKHYLITGQKIWISNAGIAELFIVFAKIEDDKNLTAFIVEKDFGGITMNPEEKKLGIKGSSTRQVFFNDCKVPVENMLSERGNGFKIAVNILNAGRIKLAVAAVGGAKQVLKDSIQYAVERKQFGHSISEFGAIKGKLAKMAYKIYASESAIYRVGQNIEDKMTELAEGGMADGEAKLKGLEQFAIECAMMKVHGSEVLDFVVDEGVQVFGGMGYSADAPMERAYRDSRIARIYEGTNEINRILAVGTVVKRAMKGEINVIEPAMAVAKELTGVPDMTQPDSSVLFSEEKMVIKALKKTILMIAGKAAQDFGQNLSDEQEVLMNLADMMIEVYVIESAVLRTEKLAGMRGEENVGHLIAMTKAYMADAVEIVGACGKRAIGRVAKSDEQKVMLMGLKRFTKYTVQDTIQLQRDIADYVIGKGGYELK